MREDKMSVISRTRRDILKGSLTSKNHHIASVLVQGWPEKIPTIEAELTALAGVESHGSNQAGKLILTLEAENDAGLVETMDHIQMTEGVVNVSLVYHHMEEMDDAK
jgi:nitrate reductase NapD